MPHRTTLPLLMALLLPAGTALAQATTAPPPPPPPVPPAAVPATQVPSPPGSGPTAQPMVPPASPYPGQPMPYASPPPYGAPAPYPMQPMPYGAPTPYGTPMPYGMPAPYGAPSPYAAPPVPPPSGVQLSTELAGTWRGEANSNGQVTQVVHILRPDGQFQTFHQVPTGQGSSQVVQVWGRYSVSAMSPNQAVVHSTPQGWAPQMVCAQGSSYCMPVHFQQTSTMVEVVDANTLRTEQGTLTRQQQ